MNNFNNAAAQFGDLSKSTVDAAMQFARIGFTGAEQFFAVNLDAAKAGFSETAKNAQAVTSLKDVQDLNSLRTNAAETSFAFAFGYSKNLYNVASATQAQYSALVEEGVNQFQKNLVDTLDKASKSAPAGSDVFVTAMKSGLAASTAAMDTVTKAAKQAATFADTAFKTAADTTEKTVKPAAKRK